MIKEFRGSLGFEYKYAYGRDGGCTTMAVMTLHCPYCRAPLAGQPSCPHCRLPLTGPIAAELWRVDQELGDMERRRPELLHRRSTLIAQLRAAATVPVRAGDRNISMITGDAGGAGGSGAKAERADISPRTVQNLLLILGGVLLTVAATVFTVVSWGNIGLAGRAAILTSVTGIALAVPALLVRRRLVATAETIAFLGLALFFLDGYAAYRTLSIPLEPRVYAALLIASAAALWAGYSLLVPLRLPRPTALVLAQLPLPILAVSESATGAAAAFVVTAGFDLAIYLVSRRDLAQGLFWAIGGVGALIALAESFVDADLPVAGVLAAAAALALSMALGGRSRTACAAAAVLAVAAPVTLVREALPVDWRVTAYTATAVLVLALTWLLPSRLRTAGALASASVAAVTAIPWAPVVATAVFGPITLTGRAWIGETVVPGVPLAPAATFGLIALAAFLLRAAGAGRGMAGGGWLVGRRVMVAGVIAGLMAVQLLLTGLPYPLVVGALTVMTLAAMAAAAAGAGERAALPAAGLATAAISWSLAQQTATLIVLGVLTAAAAGWALLDRDETVRSGAAAAAVALGAAEAAALALAVPWPLSWAGLALLGVAALTVPIGARSIAVEVSGAAVAAIGVIFTVGDAHSLSVALASTGLLALTTALRPTRRPAWYAGTALLLAAGWLRMAMAGIDLIEAYTAPFAAVALFIGWSRRSERSRGARGAGAEPEERAQRGTSEHVTREAAASRARTGERSEPNKRDSGAALSSWAAYGPGLSAALLPSTWALLTDEPGWIRPLALGIAAGSVTLIGGWRRLQAPALLGAGVMIVVAIHELAPEIAWLIGLVPRWVPLALGGLVLLAIGTTYERRLRDLRRLRNFVTRLG